MTKERKSLIIIISILAVLFCGIAIWQNNNAVSSAETSFFAMDTVMSIKATGVKAENAVKEAEEAVYELENKLSVTNENSAVFALNKDKNGALDDDLLFLFDKSSYVNKETDGAFNICIYPIMKEWGFTQGEYKVPSEGKLKDLCALVNSSSFTLDSNKKTVALSNDAMIDFGGIAKGYATKVIVDILKDNGIESALINLGGNVYALGAKSNGSNYNIAIQNPDSSKGYLGTIKVKDKAVITSGGYERYFEEDGTIYHHIIDPSTGYPAHSGAASVTVVTKDPTLGDALSTAIYVMGLDKSLEYWRNSPDEFDFIFYDEEGNLFVTEGLEHAFKSENNFKVLEK